MRSARCGREADAVVLVPVTWTLPIVPNRTFERGVAWKRKGHPPHRSGMDKKTEQTLTQSFDHLYQIGSNTVPISFLRPSLLFHPCIAQNSCSVCPFPIPRFSFRPHLRSVSARTIHLHLHLTLTLMAYRIRLFNEALAPFDCALIFHKFPAYRSHYASDECHQSYIGDAYTLHTLQVRSNLQRECGVRRKSPITHGPRPC